jgi:hypothetical protein
MGDKSYRKLKFDWKPDSAKCWIYGRGVRATLTHCYFQCTKCGELKPVSEVQLRRMPTGEVRNQPQCTACRQSGGKSDAKKKARRAKAGAAAKSTARAPKKAAKAA